MNGLETGGPIRPPVTSVAGRRRHNTPSSAGPGDRSALAEIDRLPVEELVVLGITANRASVFQAGRTSGMRAAQRYGPPGHVIEAIASIITSDRSVRAAG